MVRSRWLILTAVAVALGCALPPAAEAQAVKWLTLVGKSAAAKKALAELAESGGPAVRAALTKLGINARTDADALVKFRGLNSEQKAALLLHDSSLGRRYLSQFAAGSDDLKMQVGMYNTLRSNGIHRGLIRGDITADTKSLFAINSRSGGLVQPGRPAFQADVGTGKVTLERPFVICSSKLCNLKVQEFNAYGVGAGVSASASLAGRAIATTEPARR